MKIYDLTTWPDAVLIVLASFSLVTALCYVLQWIITKLHNRTWPDHYQSKQGRREQNGKSKSSNKV